jgi:hypothetical protein
MAYLYTSPELVASELRATTQFSESTNPAIGDVLEWIAEESAYINTIADRIFGSTVVSSEIHDLDGDESIFLFNSPVIAITSLQYNVNPIGSTLGPSWVTKVAETDYSLFESTGEVMWLPSFSPSDGRKRICVTYTTGYAELPLDVQKLATKIVAERVLSTLIQQNVNERNDGGTVSVGSISITEPASYGVASYKKLQDDIERLKKDIVKDFKLHRAWA